MTADPSTPDPASSDPTPSQQASPRKSAGRSTSAARVLAGPTAASPQASRRVLIVGRVMLGLVTVLMLAVVGRVAQIQSRPSEPIARLIDSQRSTLTLIPRRGNLVDRHGRLLGGTQLDRRLFVDPQLIDDPGTFSERVGYGLDYNPAQVERTISARLHSRYIVLDSHLTDDRLDKLAQLDLPALGLEQHPVRLYPMGHLAGQIIGFVGVDHTGLDGLEQSLDSQLQGRPGRLAYWRDARRRPIWVDQEQYQPPADGQTLRLTLDAMVQHIAEDVLEKTVTHYRAESGQIIVMHPRTGDLLAVANYPFFDPTGFRTTKPELRRNRAVTDTFEPGSTFKPFVWAAATQEGVARIDEKIDTTTEGVYRLPFGRRLRDASPHGLITWEEVLVTSSNIGMAKVAMRMPMADLHHAVRAFGFGEKPGSGLPGESAGTVHPLRKWNKYSMSSIPMGHEIAVTPMQMVRAYSVFANDGLMVRPRIVMHADDPPMPIGVQVLRPDTARLTRQIMHKVMTQGTGRRSRSSHYSMFGKSGTAQVHVPDQGGYQSRVYIANFIAAAPLDQPEVIVLCVIHKPDPAVGYYGGLVAGPAVRDVIDQTLTYLGIAPDLHSDPAPGTSPPGRSPLRISPGRVAQHH